VETVTASAVDETLSGSLKRRRIGRRAGSRNWAGRNSIWPRASLSGWLPPATGPAATCCSATPGISTRRCSSACTPEFLERLEASARDDYNAHFGDERPLESQVLRSEFVTKMVCDLLHNEDTMSMAHSVESRVPLLDLDLVQRLRWHYFMLWQMIGVEMWLAAFGQLQQPTPARPAAVEGA
jgi:hypothetical protein